jgi:hypothetical protein
MQLDIVGYSLPSCVSCQRWGPQPSRQREARTVAEREPRIASQRPQARRVDRIGGSEWLDGDRAVEQPTLGERVDELRRVGSPIGGATEDLREIDGRDDHTVSDCLRYKLGAGLIAKIGEQRRSVEYESQLLGVLSRGFCASLGEQIIDH